MSSPAARSAAASRFDGAAATIPGGAGRDFLAADVGESARGSAEPTAVEGCLRALRRKLVELARARCSSRRRGRPWKLHSRRQVTGECEDRPVRGSRGDDLAVALDGHRVRHVVVGAEISGRDPVAAEGRV